MATHKVVVFVLNLPNRSRRWKTIDICLPIGLASLVCSNQLYSESVILTTPKILTSKTGIHEYRIILVNLPESPKSLFNGGFALYFDISNWKCKDLFLKFYRSSICIYLPECLSQCHFLFSFCVRYRPSVGGFSFTYAG